MRSPYYINKYYLTNGNERVAHVHIVGDAYTVCGHYKKFRDFKRRKFDKQAFEQFCRDKELVMEGLRNERLQTPTHY